MEFIHRHCSWHHRVYFAKFDKTRSYGVGSFFSKSAKLTVWQAYTIQFIFKNASWQIKWFSKQGDKPLSEPIPTSWPSHLCGTRWRWHQKLQHLLKESDVFSINMARIDEQNLINALTGSGFLLRGEVDTRYFCRQPGLHLTIVTMNASCQCERLSKHEHGCEQFISLIHRLIF